MICKKISFALLALIALTLFTIGHADAVVQLTVTPDGGNVFVLQGKDLEGISALDLEFSYDPTVITNPKGIRGELIPSNAIFNFNPAVPGLIRLIINNGARNPPIKGSGRIATVSFDGVGDAAGNIKSLTANLVTMQGTTVLASVQILNQAPSPPSSPSSPVETASTGGTTTSELAASVTTQVTPRVVKSAVPPAVSPVVVLGTVTMSGDLTEAEKALQKKQDESPSTSDAARQQPLHQEAATSEPSQPRVEPSVSQSAPSLKMMVYPSVLDRMKAYMGDRTPKTLTALFNPIADQKVRQEPAVVVSDGESTVSVRVDLQLTLKNTPGFSFRNANMVSLEQADDGSWVIVLKPRKGTLEARITVSYDGNEIVYPLVVVPPIDPALLMLYGSPEAAFAYFLKQQGSSREPRFDLNGDGKYDYVDDYIFTAHYLAAQRNAVLK